MFFCISVWVILGCKQLWEVCGFTNKWNTLEYDSIHTIVPGSTVSHLFLSFFLHAFPFVLPTQPTIQKLDEIEVSLTFYNFLFFCLSYMCIFFQFNFDIINVFVFTWFQIVASSSLLFSHRPFSIFSFCFYYLNIFLEVCACKDYLTVLKFKYKPEWCISCSLLPSCPACDSCVWLAGLFYIQ